MFQESEGYQPSVALVSEYPPPAAGMPVLAQELLLRFQQQAYPIVAIKTNPQFPVVLRLLNHIRGLRGLLKWLIFLVQCGKIYRVDTVHIFSASGLNYILFTLPPLLIGRLLGKGIIVNYHGGAAREFFVNHPDLLKWSMKKSHELVVPSGFLKDVFGELGVSSKIVPNLANVERFDFKERELFKPLILSARNLTTVYNVKCAIDALYFIVQYYPDAELLIAGDGPEKKRLIEHTKQLGLNEQVYFLGNVANEKMPALYEQCDIFINTSNVDNMPGSILEAYASGLPVVSTNVGGIPYLVDDGISGLLADADDSEGLARHVLTILNHPEQGKAMVLQGKKKLHSLSWELVSKGWLDLYDQLYQRLRAS